MELFVEAMDREVDELHRNGIRLRFIGDLATLKPHLRRRHRRRRESARRQTPGSTLYVAVAYGGRWDIAQARRAGSPPQRAAGRHESAASTRCSRGELALGGLRRDPTSSFAPAASSASAISCSGTSPTPSSTSATACGRISTTPSSSARSDHFAARQRRFGLTARPGGRWLAGSGSGCRPRSLLAAVVIAVLLAMPPAVAVLAVPCRGRGAWEWAGFAGCVRGPRARLRGRGRRAWCSRRGDSPRIPAGLAVFLRVTPCGGCCVPLGAPRPTRGWALAAAVAGFAVLVPAAVGLGAAARSVEPQGQVLLLFLIVLIAAADIGAYFGGRALGRAQARAGGESRQDLGRLRERHASPRPLRRCSGLRPLASRRLPWLAVCRAGGPALGRRRSRREHVQAPRGSQGQRRAAARPRRRARPHRQPDGGGSRLPARRCN